MILCDTGPLVALIDGDDPHHETCVAALENLRFPDLLTTSPCLTEAMHLLRRAGGWRTQDALWGLLEKNVLRLHTPANGEWQRMRVLMRDYADAPMDVADASLVTAAETLNLRRIFTLDRHFRAYRQRLGYAFEVVP